MRKILRGLVCAGTCSILSYTAVLVSGCAGLVSGTSNSTSPTTLVVSNVQTSAITTSSSQIAWTTDAPADSSVDYGATTAFGNTTPLNSTMVTSHQVTLSGLAAGTTYYFQVNSTDSKGRHGHGGNSFNTSGFSVSGTISPATARSGTTVTLSGAKGATTTPDSSGTYTFSGLPSGSYGVKPSNPAYNFNPASQAVSVGTGNVIGVNFSASASSVAPTITIQPVSQTVTAGQTATFSVLATGTAPLSYQWQKNGANIAGATSISYMTPATATTDSGATFDVVVSNTSGSVTSSAATLTVSAAPLAPTVTMQPTNLTVTAGKTATFTVAATGTAPLSYQWQDNGANISGATSSSYTTPATTTSQSGSRFDAVVSNTAGSITSSAATLTVNAPPVPPTITTQPANQTVTAGQAATFSVVASGTTPLSYQWQKNGANIAGATGTSYTTPATATTDSGSTFDVVVTNTAGSVTSSAAALTVNAAPVAPTITTQPVNQTVTAGQTATFNVVATGTTPLSYQWKRGAMAISGATSASYTTTATTSADNGAQFTVVVSNTAGSLTSSAATLTVSATAVVPTITTQPANRTVTAGQTATFSVVASGTTPLSYQWQKNGANIAGATGTSYTTPATATTDSGSTFDVVVTNTAGSVTSSAAALTVNAAPVAPTITTQPVNQTVTAGQTATFNVVATGTTPLSYQWQKNRANIAGATGTSYSTPATATTDSGSTFDVVVTNAAGSVTSGAAILTVNAAPVAPTITTEPVNQTVIAGQTATFTVAATGTAPLNYQWQKNGANLAGAASSSYTTPVTATSDNGSTFDVVVSNSAGTVTSGTASLTVDAAAVVVTISPTSANVQTGGTQQFTATVTGTSNTAVTWTATGGTVNSSGLYTASGSAGSFTVTATSVADVTKKASAGVTVTSPPPGGANGWASRIAGINVPGGVASIVSSEGFESALPPLNAWSPGMQAYAVSECPGTPSLDNTVSADGASSLKFAIPSGTNTSCGWYDYNFSPNFASGAGNFGEGQEFFVQFKVRYDSALLNTGAISNNQGMKIDIVNEGDKATVQGADCSNNPGEFVTDSYEFTDPIRGPEAYTNCGFSGGQYFFMKSGYENLSLATGTGEFLDQDAAGCPHYGNQGISLAEPTCFLYVANEWFTVQIHIKVGTFNNPTSVMEQWFAHANAPSRLIINAADAAIVNQNQGNGTNKYGKISLVPYDTGGTFNVSTNVWYDDLIVSTRRIPDPDVGVPNAPDSLTLSNIAASGVTLNWRANSQNGTAQDDTGFLVERCTGTAQTCLPNPQSGFSQVGAAAAGANSYTDNTVVSGTTYTYRVRAKNASGSSAYTTAICFNGGTTCGGTVVIPVNAAGVAPTITTEPANQTVTAGQTATFTVAATGTAPLNYQWQKNGANLAGAASSSYTTPVTATSDNGSTFDVVVSNSAGTVTSGTASLTVDAAAVVVTISPTSANVQTGGTQQFTATVTGTSNTAVTWTATGGTVNSSGLYTASGSAGSFTVTATSAADPTKQASATVTVMGGSQAGVGWTQLAAKTTGKDTSLQSGARNICPPSGTGDGIAGDCRQVYWAWSGGVADTRRNRLLINGGGHTDYDGNEWYALDLSASPPALVRLNNPTRSTDPPGGTMVCQDAIPGSATATQAKKSSRHTRDTLLYVPVADLLYGMGGSLPTDTSCGPLIDVDVWTLDESILGIVAGREDQTSCTGSNGCITSSATPWTEVEPSAQAQADGLSTAFEKAYAYDPNTDSIFAINANDGSGKFYRFNRGTNRFTLLNNTENGGGDCQNTGTWSVIDPVNKQFIYGAADCLRSIDISGGNPSYQSIDRRGASGCSSLLNNYVGAAYDSSYKEVVIYPNIGNSVTLIDTSNWTCTQQAFGSTAGVDFPATDPNSAGTFGRFQYFPLLSEYALCPSPVGNCWVLKLP